MKKFVQIFKIPLIIFAVFLVVGIACKIITDSRPKVEFVRNNTQCATEERVFDYADKMTDAEEEALRQQIRESEQICGMDIVVVTLDQTLEDYAKSFESIIGYVEPYEYTMVFADNFYDENMFGFDKPHGDGIVFVDNWYRESDGGVYSWLSTSGRAMDILTTDNVEFILDMALDYVEDDPAYAYGYLVELVTDYMDPDSNLGDDLGIYSVLIGLVAGIIFFFANRGGKKGKNTVESKAYVKSHNANLLENQDIFITKTMSRRKIETQTTTRSGGGGHISAGGHSHGGGGHRR